MTVSLARPGGDSERLASQAPFAAYGVEAGCAWSPDGTAQGPRAEGPGGSRHVTLRPSPIALPACFVSGGGTVVRRVRNQWRLELPHKDQLLQKRITLKEFVMFSR